MTRFCTCLNRLQYLVKEMKCSSYIKDGKVKSKVIGANCTVNKIDKKKEVMDKLYREIRSSHYPLFITDISDTNGFKIIFDDHIK